MVQAWVGQKLLKSVVAGRGKEGETQAME